MTPRSFSAEVRDEKRRAGFHRNIRLDGGTQPRAALNVNAIEDYAKAMSAGAKFPPVAVFYDGEHYWLADGFHRIKAGCAAGLDVIDCEVHQGTVEDAQWYSFSANKANGLRRTNSDKQRAVKAALAHPRSGSLSNSEIARHCGVTTPMVGKWRAATRTIYKKFKDSHGHPQGQDLHTGRQ